MVKARALVAAALVMILCAAGTAAALEKGNDRKGKYTYRKVYKACMERGEVASAKPTVNPDMKTQAEWTQVFETKNFTDFGCQPEWAALSETDLMDIYAYLYNHASDSPTPAKCQ